MDEFRVLRFVEQVDGISGTAISHHVGMHPSKITRIIQRLVQQDLVVDKPDLHRDGRHWALACTQQGRRNVKEILEDASNQILTLPLKAFGEEKAETLAGLLHKLGTCLDACPTADVRGVQD
jgi:DNA-binding MarR family transcriptional regulator